MTSAIKYPSLTVRPQSSLSALVQSFSQLRLIAIGDVILDRYWWGDANRLSPEAPVPVLLKLRTTALPGGAANAAANIAALGSSVQLLGVVGEDAAAQELRDVLSQKGIGTTQLIPLKTRPTTTKTRIIAAHQQLLRVDEEDTSPIDASLNEAVLALFRSCLKTSHGVVVSDYAKGFLRSDLISDLIADAGQAGVPVFIDPKGHDPLRYRGATLLKPNRLELGALVGYAVRTHEDTLKAGRSLRDRLPDTNLLVTEAAEGMTYFSAAGDEHHIASEAQELFDITGAGDTVLAAFAAAALAGASIQDALRVATTAAGISVSKLGASTVSPGELIDALTRTS